MRLRCAVSGQRGIFLALLRITARRPRSAAFGDIFRAVDRADMRWIEAEIRAADAVLSSVRVDPFPECFARIPSLIARGAVDADDISGQPVAITAAQTAAVIRPVARCFQAAGDPLTVVVAETAGDAGL